MATINPSFYGPNYPAFLDTLSHSEGTDINPLSVHGGYDVIVDSIHGHLVFTDFSCHPFCVPGKPRPLQVLNHAVPPLDSSASGRYQLMRDNWAPYRDLLKVPDFGPLSQDKIALQQIRECHAWSLIGSGKIAAALLACNHIWASLPGDRYGQGGKSMGELLDCFAAKLKLYQ